MDNFYHRFSELFQQLGLSRDQAEIRKFIDRHSPLALDIRLEDAPFWTPAQAALLKEKLLEDADWSEVIDQLSLALRRERHLRTNAEIRVICLCAAWCSVCRDFIETYRSAQEGDPNVVYELLDIEDDVERLGEVEVENFPCVLVGAQGEPVFFGAIAPNRASLERLIRKAPDMPPLPADYPDRNRLVALLAEGNIQFGKD